MLGNGRNYSFCQVVTLQKMAEIEDPRVKPEDRLVGNSIPAQFKPGE